MIRTYNESVNKHVLNTYYMPGTVLSPRDTKKGKNNPYPQGAHTLGEITCKQ